MHVWYDRATRRIVHLSEPAFTETPPTGEAVCEIAAADRPGPVSQLRLTDDLTGLEVDPALVPPPAPDWNGFRLTCLGGIMGENYPAIATLIDQYTSFIVAIQYENANLLRAAIARARAHNVADPATGIDATLEAALLAAATAHHIPVE